MIRNLLNVALRNLVKQRFYSLINILGLSIGLTCFMLISLFVIDELSYDQFHSKRNQIYRMDFNGTINGNNFVTALASPITAEVMLQDFPEVEDAVRMRGIGDRLLKRKDDITNYKEQRVIFADKNFFEFFEIPVLAGEKTTALERPNTMAISKSISDKIFGDEDPIGQTLIIDNDDSYEVTLVFEDMPSNMHFHYDVLFSMEGLEEAQQKIWLSFNFNTYLRLTQGTDPLVLESKFPELIVDKYLGPEFERFMGKSMDELGEEGAVAGFTLFPLKDIHLHSDKLGELEANGSIQYVYIFSAIALFILILACINFMNLSTARSANRAKEVGVRKVMGAYKGHLITQFLTEAFMITLVSILIAFALSYILLLLFNELADKSISSTSLFSPIFYSIMLGVLIIVGFLAGSYPAFYLSAFKPVDVLKGKINLGMKSGGVRSTLVVIQFTVSIIMIVGTLIVFNQLNYIQNKKLGFNKEQVIMIEDAWLLDDKLESFKNEAKNLSGVVNGTIATFLPVGTTNNNNLWFKGQQPGKGDNFIMHNYRIDHDYISTLDMEIVSGRDFSRDFLSDSSAVVINEAAARELGYEDPVGEYMCTYGGRSVEQPEAVVKKIIGVVKDFHYSSMRENITGLIFSLDRSRGYISFRLNPENISATVDQIEGLWEEFGPGQPFAYSFMDDRFDRIYTAEQRIGDIFSVFAFLALFIACLGLYGLAAFTAEQKTKEIGIRKVLGASISQIIFLLGKEFLRLVAISFIIGSAVSYFAMREWLNDFVYRININNPAIFIFAGFSAVAISWLTMSYQSYRAARTNPVNSLKDE